MNIALVTTDPAYLAADPDLDMAELVPALARLGHTGEPVRWRDPEIVWGSFDLVVVRSPWDYTGRFAEFRDWLARVSAVAPVRNCPHVLQWSWDKHYLAELDQLGVAVVPTQFVSDAAAIAGALEAVDSPRVVIKPTVSASAKDTGLFDIADVGASELALKLVDSGRTAMIQPELPSVTATGETALIYFAGEFSHAVRKGPLLAVGGSLIGGEYTEVIDPVMPGSQERQLGEAVLAAVAGIRDRLGCDCHQGPPLYARIDVADLAGAPVVLEAELVEPSVFLPTDPGAPDRFAAAIAAAL